MKCCFGSPMSAWMAGGGILALAFFWLPSLLGETPDSSGGTSSKRDGRLTVSEQLKQLDQYRLTHFGQQRGDGLGGQGGAGGSPLANFNELINIIETVVAGDWESQGGSSTMIPHPNGVRINTQGVIERISQSDTAKRNLSLLGRPKADLSSLGEWQSPSPLRWISLSAIDELGAKRLKDKSVASVAMELLGGLYRIDYVAYDEETREWMIGGPAGNLTQKGDGQLINEDTGLPPVLLEDLLSIAPIVLSGDRNFGCTIDPDPVRLVKSHDFSRKPSSIKALQRDPDRWAEQWKKELGNQNTRVSGVPEDSPTGYAMLIADAEMKRLGMGLDPLPMSIRSYWQEADYLRQQAGASMVRWWFSVSDVTIPMDKERHIYSFEKSNVRLMSEAQHFDQSGRRVASAEADPAADRFASTFTQKFESLHRDYPIFGRLRHIMDLAVAMEIIRLEMESGRGKSFSVLHRAEIQPHMGTAPKEIESIVATHKAFDGSRLAVVSGGVTVYLGDVRKRLRPSAEKLNHVVVKSGFADKNSPTSDREIFWR